MGIKKENRGNREQEIFEAAYLVLGEKGYKATSMLAIAKAASASNETLYAWYKNKQGLLAAMIMNNANSADKIFKQSALNKEPTSVTLQKAGMAILKLTTSKRAVILNRAAAADVSEGGKLGQLITQNGRNLITPLIADVFLRAMEHGRIKQTDAREVSEVFIALLLGDSQIRRVIGVAKELSDDVIHNHTERCLEIIYELYGV